MGSGKTQAMIEKMKNDSETSYIFVTPFLDEIKRIINQTSIKNEQGEVIYRHFKQPQQFGNGKLDNLHQLLSNGCNIATTHALFLTATQETIQLIHEGGYTLVLDEELTIFKEYNDVVKNLDNKIITCGDVKFLIQERYISVSQEDYTVSWVGASVDGFHYSEVERLAKSGSLRCVDNVLYWEYPKEIFEAFEKIFVLTYRFEGSMFDSYLKFNNMTYEKMSAERNEQGNFCLCQYKDDSEIKRELFSLIDIYSGHLNHLGNKRNAFSINWLKGINNEGIKKIRNSMRSYQRQKNACSSLMMWTTTKQFDFYKKLEAVNGFKYTRKLTAGEQNLPDEELQKLRCFVPCNSKATNNYSDRTVCLYLVNRFPSPEIKKYFRRRGYPIDEDSFATNEMIQWIWRSAIRNGEKISLYIPSSRMRKLLYSWFGVKEPLYEPRTRGVS